MASTLTFDTAGRTMTGDTPEQASRFVHSLPTPVVAYGANCGAGPAPLIDTLCGFARNARPADVIIAKGSCGVPESVGGELVYSGTEEIMGRYARLARDAGASIIGGCCGTTPAHLAAIAHALEGYRPGDAPDDAAIEAALGPLNSAPSGQVPRQHRRRRVR